MSDKTTPKKLLLTVGALLVLVAGGTTAVLLTQGDKKPAPSAAQQQTGNDELPLPSNSIAYDGVEGKTALELLKTEATVLTKDSDYGPYVDSINGLVGGTDGKYWAFYVNGQMSPVGADAYKTKNGDKIEWKFE